MECTKRKHMSRGAAEMAVRQLTTKRSGVKKRDLQLLCAYRCRACGFWHVGHRHRTNDKGQRTKDKQA